MAAFETPWADLMSNKPNSRREVDGVTEHDHDNAAIANFSPITLSQATSANKQRSTILVHQKSPLLIATPPQITRALAYSHPFLLPLNKLVGLLTWTSGDPWESFLLVAGFWGGVLYGDTVIRWAGPVVAVFCLILGMYSRRFSPLSSTGWTPEMQRKGHKKSDSEFTSIKHQKTLDEMVDTLKLFTSRCNVLLNPLLEMTDFLSTQRTATSATTRPALTTLLLRILLITPLWVILTIYPFQIITSKQIFLVVGTIFLTWHSRPTKVSRAILWRSIFVRRVCTVITGLHFGVPLKTGSLPLLPPRRQSAHRDASLVASASRTRKPDGTGVKFTFMLYENQRRWVGLGWTTSLFAYERSAWTDEQLNAAPSKEEFELPDVEGGGTRWRWVEGSQWLVEGAGEYDEGGSKAKLDTTSGGQGWIYYDSKWQNGRRGQDSWGRYTRRRKWYRVAELVEGFSSTEATPSQTPNRNNTSEEQHLPFASIPELPREYAESISSFNSQKSIFRGGSARRRTNAGTSSRRSSMSLRSNNDDDEPPRPRGADWGIGDDARMGLE